MAGSLYPPIEIETPWPEKTIAWRYNNHARRAQTIRSQIDAGQAYVVREVLVRSKIKHDYSPLSIDEIEETLGHTEQEFSLLRACGIIPAPTEWHIFSDPDGNNRTLARVAVVDGESFPRKYRSEMSNEERTLVRPLEISVGKYHSHPTRLQRLGDIYRTDQYLHGTFRDPGLQYLTPELTNCLIDTEPIFWLKLST